jgi:hypothetical protein
MPVWQPRIKAGYAELTVIDALWPEVRRYWVTETEKWGKVIRAANIKSTSPMPNIPQRLIGRER